MGTSGDELLHQATSAFVIFLLYWGGFPCGSTGKESAYNVGDPGSTPELGRPPRERKGYPFLENYMDCIAHGVMKGWTRLSDFHFIYWGCTYVLFKRKVSAFKTKIWKARKQNPGKSPILSLFLTSGWGNTGLEWPCWVARLHMATWLEGGKPKPEPSLLLVSVHPSHLCHMCLFLLEQGLRPPFTCVKHRGRQISLLFGIAGSTVSVRSGQESNLYSEMNVCSPPSSGLLSAQGPTHGSTRQGQKGRCHLNLHISNSTHFYWTPEPMSV